jgi:hypothetical protein
MGTVRASAAWPDIAATLAAPRRQRACDRATRRDQPRHAAHQAQAPRRGDHLRPRGSLEYQVDGRPPTTVRAGEVFFVPAETVHAVRNTEDGNGVELATYIVEKGKPLFGLAQ